VHLSYPDGQALTLLTTETLRLPFQHSSLKATNFQLLEVNPVSNTYIENCFSKATLVKNERNKQGVNYIKLGPLPAGRYILWLKKEGVRMSLNVHQGENWNQTYEFLMKERSIIERTRQRIDCLRIDQVSISNVEVEDDQGGKKTAQRVLVQVGGDYNQKRCHVHAWAFKFFPYDVQGSITDRLGSSQKVSGVFRSTLFNFT